jgi:hypothetical protein
VAKQHQWLTSRQILSDWNSRTQSGEKNLVSLEKQEPGFSNHPLMIGNQQRFGVGLQRPVTPDVTHLPIGEFPEGAELTTVNFDDLDEVGYQRPTTPQSSRLPAGPVQAPLLGLIDVLATEDGRPICDMDGNPLGLV